jgi:hypothetical protein
MATALALSPDQLHHQKRSAQLYQARFDDALAPLGIRAPAPTLGQDPDQYRREVLRHLKREYLPQNHKFYQMNMRGLPSGDILNNFEPQILDAVVTEAQNPANVPTGQLRKITRLDATGRTLREEYIGQQSFVVLPSFGTDIPNFGGGHRPGRRLTSWRLADQGYLHADGRPIELQRHRP